MSTNLPDVGVLENPALPPQIVQDSGFLERAIAKAQTLVIETPEAYGQCAEALKTFNTMGARFEDQRVDVTKPLLDAKRKWDALFKGPIDKCGQLVALLKGAMRRFDDTQRIAREKAEREAAEQRRTEERARADLLEAERREAARIADEQRRQAEADAEKRRQEAQAKMATATDSEALANAADELDRADFDEADSKAAADRQEAERTAAAEQDALLSSTAPVIAEYVPAAPVVAGITKRLRWEHTSDIARLIAALPTRPELAAYLLIDEKKVGGVVRALGSAHNLPFVDAHQVEDIAAARR